MKSSILILLIFKFSVSLSLNNNEFKKYVKSTIETVYSEKKVYIFSYNYSIKKRQERKFYDYLKSNYKIDSLRWDAYWSGYKNNVIDYNLWYKKGISTNKKDRILGDFDEENETIVRKKKFLNSVVISYSCPLFLDKKKSDFLLEITSHCYGLCSYSWIYFVHFNREKNIIEIKHKIMTSFS